MLVLPVKIFEIKGDSAEFIFKRLRDFHEAEEYKASDGKILSLTTEILDLKLEDGLIRGIFSRDFVRRRSYKREVEEVLSTEEAPFWIRGYEKRVFLVVSAPSVARGVRKLLTNHVANKLSEVLYGRVGYIVEARISNETLQRLHEANPQATKLIWFDDVDIPSVEKLCIAGSSLADTQLYRDYLEHGKIWYVVFEDQRRGVVVGITRNCVVTLFSKSTIEEFINYIFEDLLKLIE
ncbi:MAG: hypothetical protein QW638_06820 [Candidatus Bathyarchaeia archaeon]|nr:hypothetical protein [Candidatus Bathyarchaeota archaeon]